MNHTISSNDDYLLMLFKLEDNPKSGRFHGYIGKAYSLAVFSTSYIIEEAALFTYTQEIQHKTMEPVSLFE